jgi:hypothetical protein
MLALAAALFLVGLTVFIGVLWIRAIEECHRLRFARLWWENDGLYRRLAEKTRAVGRLLQTLAGDGTRRN